MHALVLSGGGALGAWSAGAASEIVRFFATTHEPIALISGTSVGAANAAKLVQDGPDPLLELWRNVTRRDVYVRGAAGPLTSAYRLLRGRPLYDTRPLAALLGRELSAAKIAASRCELRVHAADLGSRALVTWTGRSPGLLEAIRGSMAIPGLFPPVRVGGLALVDGGVVANAPIGPAIRAGATRVTVLHPDNEVVVPPREAEELLRPKSVTPAWLWDRSALRTLKRSLEIMLTGHMERDIRMTRMANQLDSYRTVRLDVISPPTALDPDGGALLDFRREVLDALLERGIRDGRRWIRRRA